METRKLVRSRLRFRPPPERFKGRQTWELCDPEEYPALLLHKLDEEVLELKQAIAKKDLDGTYDEIVDVREVLRAIGLEFADCSEGIISEGVRQKRDVSGDFETGVVLVTHEERRVSYKPVNFMLNEQHTTHLTRAQWRKERRVAGDKKKGRGPFVRPKEPAVLKKRESYRSANAAARKRLKKTE